MYRVTWSIGFRFSLKSINVPTLGLRVRVKILSVHRISLKDVYRGLGLRGLEFRA